MCLGKVLPFAVFAEVNQRLVVITERLSLSRICCRRAYGSHRPLRHYSASLSDVSFNDRTLTPPDDDTV